MNIFTNDKSAILLQDLVYNSFFDNEQIIEDNNPTEDDIFIYIVGMNIDFDFYTNNLNSLEKLISDLNRKFSTNFKDKKDKGFEAKDFLKVGRTGGEFPYCSNHLTKLWDKEFKKDNNQILILT